MSVGEAIAGLGQLSSALDRRGSIKRDQAEKQRVLAGARELGDTIAATDVGKTDIGQIAASGLRAGVLDPGQATSAVNMNPEQLAMFIASKAATSGDPALRATASQMMETINKWNYADNYWKSMGQLGAQAKYGALPNQSRGGGGSGGGGISEDDLKKYFKPYNVDTDSYRGIFDQLDSELGLKKGEIPATALLTQKKVVKERSLWFDETAPLSTEDLANKMTTIKNRMSEMLAQDPYLGTVEASYYRDSLATKIAQAYFYGGKAGVMDVNSKGEPIKGHVFSVDIPNKVYFGMGTPMSVYQEMQGQAAQRSSKSASKEMPAAGGVISAMDEDAILGIESKRSDGIDLSKVKDPDQPKGATRRVNFNAKKRAQDAVMKIDQANAELVRLEPIKNQRGVSQRIEFMKKQIEDSTKLLQSLGAM